MNVPLLRLLADDDQRDTWVVALIADVATGRGWACRDGGSERPDAVALVRGTGGRVPATDEPTIVVAVEAGTPRAPVPVESAAHLPARLELTVGAFKARRNQQVTRDAVERFLVRVEQTRPASGTAAVGPAALEAEPLDPAEAVARADAGAIAAENRALIEQVDAWLARTTMTPDAAQAVHADRTILDAALGAPVLDLVIIERAAARLAATIA